MPRYHFDPKGLALPDAEAARQQAKLAARTFRRNLRTDEFKVRVTDDAGHVIYEVHPDEES
jgi:hypothetical protein